jgi:hypothetical protein
VSTQLEFCCPNNGAVKSALTTFFKTAQMVDAIYGQPDDHNDGEMSDVGRYLAEDLMLVNSGMVARPAGHADEWYFCSTHRRRPRWGAPLVSLSANDLTNRVSLHLRTGGQWADDEIMPPSLSLPSVEPLVELRAKWAIIEAAHELDYWVGRRDSYIVVEAGKFRQDRKG